MKQKAFFIIVEGLSLKQIMTIFLEGESPTLNLKLKAGYLKTDYAEFVNHISTKWAFYINSS